MSHLIVKLESLLVALVCPGPQLRNLKELRLYCIDFQHWFLVVANDFSILFGQDKIETSLVVTLFCWYDLVELSEQNEGISLENKLSCKWILKFENCTKIELSLVYKNTLYWNFQIIKTGTISFQISDFCHF